MTPYYLTWASQGEAGSGKNHFLLTAPEPIWVAVWNDPGGVSRMCKKPEFAGKDIRWKEYAFNPGKHQQEDRGKVAKDVIDQFLDDYRTVLKHARTVGWDKEDQVYEALRYARNNQLAGKPPSFHEIYNEYKAWFHEAGEAGVNLALLRGMKEKWGLNEKGSPTGLGVREARGSGEVNEQVMVVLHHYWDDDERAFKVRIGGQEGDQPKCRVGPAQELNGQVCTNLTFEELAMQLYPETVDDMTVWGLE